MGKPGIWDFLKIELDICLISSTSPASLRLLARFAWEIVHFVHHLATHMEIKKLQSEGVAVYVYSVSIYYA